MSKITKSIFWGVLLILAFAACTCSTEQAIQKVLGTGTETPVFLGVKALSARVIRFDFSNPVKVSSINFDPPLEIRSIEDSFTQEGAAVAVNLTEALGEGERFVADLLVEDERGNTLGVLISFRSRNERMPGLLITELRTEYAKPKVEFVEIKTLSAGNLGAIRLFTAGTSMTEPVFEFPPVEVAAGQYLVLHLRTLDPASVNETGVNLALSPGTEAFPDTRDFWVPGALKRLRKTDAVLLLDQDGAVLDGVLLSENPDTPWKEAMNQAAAQLTAREAWLSPAVPTKGTTATRTICRDETTADTNSAADWYITGRSQASPGKPNSAERYAPEL
ncbi:hypothetical protein AGMMS49942_15430 [Spirochaetia bacterium]|nr:hypothetical protein AGMMS49942_15430 [Spirochaetia bacterium]